MIGGVDGTRTRDPRLDMPDPEPSIGAAFQPFLRSNYRHRDALLRTTLYNYWQHDDRIKVRLSPCATSDCRAVTVLTMKSLGKHAENLIVSPSTPCGCCRRFGLHSRR